MQSAESMNSIEADPNDPEDFPVDQKGVQLALSERRRRRGRPAGSNKERLTIRLDKEVVAKFKATGPGWQSRINDVLKGAKVA